MIRNISHICLVVSVLGMGLGMPRNVDAQRLVLEASAGPGAGVAFESDDDKTSVGLSPLFVDIDIIVSNTEFRHTEYVIGLRAGLQGGVSAGIIPQLRFTMEPRIWTVYGLIGAPLIIAPERMFGVEAGAGVYWQLQPRFALFFEGVMDMYFLGKKALPDNAVLVQLNGVFGIRLKFK